MARRIVAAVVVAGLSLPALLRAEERKIKAADVPRPVVDAVKKKYPRAKLVGFEQETEQGKLIYEVAVKAGARKIDVDVAPDGKILAEETLIKADELPAAVKKGLASSKYAKWAIKRAEQVVTNEQADRPSYELIVADHGSVMEVVLDQTGAVTKQEKKRAADDD